MTHPLYRKKADLSIKPLKYVDPIGFFTFVFMHMGWQKPMEINANRFQDRSKGLLAVALTGILSNLLLMTILIPVFYALSPAYNALSFDTSVFGANSILSYVRMFIFYLIYFNFSITIMNLLPVPPFDMTKIIYALSPNTYFKLIQYERIIQAVFILALVMGFVPILINSLFLLIL